MENKADDVTESGSRSASKSPGSDLLYGVEEVPPWYLCVILGFQHYLTAFGSTITVPLVLASHFCLASDVVGISEVISTIFFVSGLCTLLQTTVGVRLPIVQGATFAFLTPTIAVLSSPQWSCPYNAKDANLTLLPDPGSPNHQEIWHSRIREIQGAIMVSCVFQVVIGFTGIMGLILQYIGPLAIAPTITLTGMSLFEAAALKAATQWWIAIMTVFLIALFSQYLSSINVPLFCYSRGKGCDRLQLPIFKLFPVLLAMLLSWAICGILTVAGALPENPGEWGYAARTDTNSEVLHKSKWFRFPYPGQWGMPTVSVSAVFGMLAGVLASMIESVGDYYACARLSGAPPPPVHAVNRGIGVEGIGCILAGAWGSGNGTTSYSENIGAIGVTKVGSRRVVQVGGILMILLGCLGKFGALFVTIPEPVVGGMFLVMFGMVTAIGLSNLKFIDLASSRNIFILGVAIFFGLSFPHWMGTRKSYINTGSTVADQIISVLLSTSMFVGGFVGFVLDNTIPGTEEERGISKWRTQVPTGDGSGVQSGDAGLEIYDIPFIQKYLNNWRWTYFVPFCPAFMQCVCCKSRCCKRKNSDEESKENVVGSTLADNRFDLESEGNSNIAFAADTKL
ncbi:hypothetical protein ScPMuIL_016193 [Solemya velum]